MASVYPQTARTTEPLRSDISTGWDVKQGVVGGLITGIIFAMFEMIATAIIMGPEAFFMPLRMIGAILLSPAALDPSYSLVTAGIAGLVVHMLLSAVYGAVFGALVADSRQAVLNTTAGLLVAASLYGLVLWLVNFFIIAPALFPWFTQTNQVVQFLAHTFFFGTALGIYSDWMEHRRRAATVDEESRELGEWVLKVDPNDIAMDA